MKTGETYENIFSGTKVKVITAQKNAVEYERSPVSTFNHTNYPPEEIIQTRFIKPRTVFWSCYQPVNNLLPEK